MDVSQAYQPRTKGQIKSGDLFLYPGPDAAELYLKASRGFVVRLGSDTVPALFFQNRRIHPEVTLLAIDATLVPTGNSILWSHPEPGDLVFRDDKWYLCASGSGTKDNFSQELPPMLIAVSDGECMAVGDGHALCFSSWKIICKMNEDPEEQFSFRYDCPNSDRLAPPAHSKRAYPLASNLPVDQRNQAFA
jgi:hypothetical protein